jgi:predicted nuclease with TOPRIM domain
LAGELDQCVEKTIKKNYVRKDVYEMLFDKCERLESNLDFLHKKLSTQERARVMRIKDLKKRNDNLQNRIQDLYNRLEKKSWNEINAPRYMFSEIPNDCDGQRFTDDMKKYLNTSRYSMRVRGQHVKEEYKGTGVTTHGQNIEQSTHLRVYIEEKD